MEQASLQWLKVGNKHIEKQLYPHFRQRLWRRMVSAARKAIPEEPTPSIKPKEAPANTPGENWLEQHIHQTPKVNQHDKTDDRKAQAKSTSKTPRVRVSERENHAIRISR